MLEMHGKFDCLKMILWLSVIFTLLNKSFIIHSHIFVLSEHLEKSSCKRWLLAHTMSKMLAYIPSKYDNKRIHT